MALKLSIVVPIYKVEQYLAKCVESLLNQDLLPEEYEIILVNDGSPDHCGEICEDYASRFDHIKVFHRENGGLSAARNSGINIAQGKYIQFVDPDDYLEPNVLKVLLDKIESGNLDILRFNYQNVNANCLVFEPNKEGKLFVDYRDEVCNGLTFLTERLGFGCYAWQFVIRRELLENCRFKEGIYFEDSEWTPRLMMKAQRVTSTNLMAYNYLFREGSITQSVDENKRRKVLDDKFLLLDSMKEQMQRADDKRWFEGMVSLTALSIIGYVCENYYDDREIVLQNLKSKKVFPLSLFHSTQAAARKIRLANLSLRLLCLLIGLKNK